MALTVLLTLPHGFQAARGPTQASYAKSQSKAHFPADKTARELISQLPLRAEFKNAWSYTAIHIFLHGMSIKLSQD